MDSWYTSFRSKFKVVTFFLDVVFEVWMGARECR